MIENISSRTNISVVLLRNSQAPGAETPRQWHPDRQHATNIVPIHTQPWRQTGSREPERRSRKNKLRGNVTVETRSRTAEVVSPRQWLLTKNPRLASLITATIGDRWMTHGEDLQQLVTFADDADFQSQWQTSKRISKQIFADTLYRSQGIEIDVDSLFDLQLQPIVGRQRQLLNILHIISLYQQIKAQPEIEIVPRTFIFGDVSEPKLQVLELEESTDVSLQPNARSISILIAALAQTLATDPDVRGRLQVVYLPQTAGLIEQLYGAAELTERIATAGMEDVDLNQLKLSVNGALSIASMSKANHFLQQTVGADNCFSFGLAIPEIAMFKEYGYDPYNYYKYYPEIRQAIDALMAGSFTAQYPGIARSLVDLLLDSDEHMVLADFVFYRACQSHVSEVYRQKALWTRMSILNVAAIG
jgi:glycogen phosphorylase